MKKRKITHWITVSTFHVWCMFVLSWIVFNSNIYKDLK